MLLHSVIIAIFTKDRKLLLRKMGDKVFPFEFEVATKKLIESTVLRYLTLETKVDIDSVNHCATLIKKTHPIGWRHFYVCFADESALPTGDYTLMTRKEFQLAYPNIQASEEVKKQIIEYWNLMNSKCPPKYVSEEFQTHI